MYALWNNDGPSKEYQYQLNVGAAEEPTTPPSPKTSGAHPWKPFGIVAIVTFVLIGCAVLAYLGYRWKNRNDEGKY
ncbi:hypothetical protein AAFF_G00393020 [Aldrovandia affinis]|uniref:Uncharacterized protein n=1 Tax=Aldrovandia affinis TaxID=143900 RepID=A0AAD7VY50_9TELE|nr:hypothetical protein AAFF_G00393020 [Aldrovandia affinis]